MKKGLLIGAALCFLTSTAYADTSKRMHEETLNYWNSMHKQASAEAPAKSKMHKGKKAKKHSKKHKAAAKPAAATTMEAPKEEKKDAK